MYVNVCNIYAYICMPAGYTHTLGRISLHATRAQRVPVNDTQNTSTNICA